MATLREEIQATLHHLWTKAVGTQDYDKKEWQHMEALLGRLYASGGWRDQGTNCWQYQEDHPEILRCRICLRYASRIEVDTIIVPETLHQPGCIMGRPAT